MMLVKGERILALLRGEQVGEVCSCPKHALEVALGVGKNYHDCANCPEPHCNGTGRINTEPMGEVEREAHGLWVAFKAMVDGDTHCKAVLAAEQAKVARV